MRKLNFLYMLVLIFFVSIGFAQSSDSLAQTIWIEKTKYEDQNSQDQIEVINLNSEDYAMGQPSYQPEFKTEDFQHPTTFTDRQFDPNFKDNYKDKAFDYEREPKNIDPDLDFGFLENLFIILEIVFYIVIVLVVGLALYYLMRKFTGISFGKSKPKLVVTTNDEFEEKIDDIEKYDFEQLIQQAKSEKNYRKAIRYYYLWILQKLSDRKLIDWQREKTNLQYLYEVQNHSIHSAFSRSIYLYDYAWYGNFDIDENVFAQAESILRKTLNQIN